MRVLVLNRFALDRTDYASWLGPDAEVVVITGKADERQLGRYLDALVVADFNDTPLVEYHALNLHERHGFDAVVAMSEFDILRAARIRTSLGIPGQDLTGALAYRDKLRMKERLHAAGVPVARFTPVDSATDLITFARRTGYPIVVKPRRGASSVGVRVLASERELAGHLATDRALRGDDDLGLIAEEFVPHELYHVDGMVSGKATVLCWPSRMSSCLGFQDGDILTSATLDRADPLVGPLRGLTQTALDALPTPETTLFHAEVFRRDDGELVLNEIACRLGGGKIRAAVQLAFGVNLQEWYLRRCLSSCADPIGPAEPIQMAGFALFPPQPGRLVRAPVACDIDGVVSYQLSAETGQDLGAATSSIDSIATVTAAAATQAAVFETLDLAIRWFTDSVEFQATTPASGHGRWAP